MLKPIVLILTALLTLGSHSAAAQEDPRLQTGIEAFQRGDYAAVLASWRPLAEEGNAPAQYNLAQLYRRGQGVTRNLETAAKWYRQAALNGHASAQYALALMHGRGDGVEKDLAESAHWAEMAAKNGHQTAQTYLGALYAQGAGVPQDLVRSYAWYALAASQGDEDARQNLEFVRGRMSQSELQRARQLSVLAHETVGTVSPDTAVGNARRVYGPLREDETLWSVAEALRPSPDISLYQMLRAFLKSNPNLKRIKDAKPGTKIVVPNIELITEVSAEVAKKEILSQLAR